MAAERDGLRQSDFAARVLEEAAQPLHYDEITRRVIEHGWIDATRTATPQRSLYRAITEEVRLDPGGARFAYDRGVVRLRRWDTEPPVLKLEPAHEPEDEERVPEPVAAIAAPAAVAPPVAIVEPRPAPVAVALARAAEEPVTVTPTLIGAAAGPTTIAEVTRMSLLGFLPQMPPSQLTAIVDRRLQAMGFPASSEVVAIEPGEVRVQVSLPLEWVVDTILSGHDGDGTPSR